MRGALLVSCALALGLSACGSTVQVSRSASLGGDGLGAPAGTGSSTTTQAGDAPPGTTAGPGPAALGATVPPTATAPAALDGTGPASGGSTAQAGRAPGGGPVEIGVLIFPDVNAAAKSLGGSADVGDQKSEFDLAVRWVNAHGGLAGHQVKPVYYEVALTSTQSYSSTYQQACARFTQDHKVVAAIMVGNAEAQLPACLNKAGALFLSNGHYLHTPQDYGSLPNLVSPNEVNSDAVARTLSAEILARKLVKSGDTLGLLVMDYKGPQQAKDRYLVPAMSAHGVKVLSYTIPYPQSTQDIGNSASAIQSAELAMAAAGVRNVAFLCPGCVSFFMSYAESQAYYPRYLQTSLDTLIGLRGKGHGKSLSNTFALGWDPVRDVSTYTDPSVMAANSTYRLCRSVEKANITQDASLFASIAFCGALQDLYAAARANPTARLTGSSLMAGFSALAGSHLGASSFTTLLRGNKHDGTSSYRTMHYDAGCDCLVYDNTRNLAFR